MKKKIYDLRLENIVHELEGLRKVELEKLAKQVSELLHSGINQNLSAHNLHSDNTKLTCGKCGSLNLVKRGRDARGNQRYLCKECGASRTSISTSVFRGTHKDAEQWKEFILCTLEGRSLQYCADHCQISLPTSFAWRHKILNALTIKQFSNDFSGIVEVDETFVNVSYKGNHSKSKGFVMPRPAYKRGSDNKSRSTSDKACVVCATERNKSFSGIVTHRGALKQSILSEVFDKHISNDTIVITDESKALTKYFKDKPYVHKSLGSIFSDTTQKTVPVVSGPYHINNINSLHQRFRDFLRLYKGVSTKRLNNYVALFIWLQNENNKSFDSIDRLIDFLVSNPTHITRHQIMSVSLPQIA